MPLHAITKDCTALSDDELDEMAELAATGPKQYAADELAGQRDAWVLVTSVRDGARLAAWGFVTLERIGGDPVVLIGAAATRPTARRNAALAAMVSDQLRRAVLAFPDEDVLVAAQLCDPAALVAFKGLQRVVPRTGYEPNGEDRAWGRRLAKRFDVVGEYKAREFRVHGDGRTSFVISHAAAQPDRPDSIAASAASMFDGLDALNGDALIVFGWASREDLAKLL